MKVGDILKSDIKDISGLKYPYKIIINDKCKYPPYQKMENDIFLGFCNTFLNNLPRSKTLRKTRSHSQKKNLKFISQSAQKLFQKKNSENVEKISKRPFFVESFPILGDSTLRANSKLNSSKSKVSPLLFRDFSIIKNKVEKKNLIIRKEEKKNANFYSQKKIKKIIGTNPIIIQRKPSNQIRDIIFNSNLKNKNNKIFLQNILEYRMNKKILKLNNIIDKLNTPIFIINKTETN